MEPLESEVKIEMNNETAPTNTITEGQPDNQIEKKRRGNPNFRKGATNPYKQNIQQTLSAKSKVNN